MKKIKSLSKRYMGLAYVVVVAVLFVAWALHTGQVPAIVRQLSGLSLRWIWISAALLIGYVVLRALTLYVYLAGEKHPIAFWKALSVTGIGQFYSAITPSSSGGQPFEVFSMTRWGVPAPVAPAAVSVQFIGFQLALIALGAAVWIASRGRVALQLGGVRWLVALGFVINSVIPALIISLSVNGRLMNALTRVGVRLLARLRLVRHPEAAQKKVDKLIAEYRTSLIALFEKPALAVKVLLLSLVQVFVLMSIIVGIYRDFALSGTYAATLITLQTLLYITASFMPLPGASGAQEYGFSVFFGGIFPDSTMVSAIFLWRFFTYYLLMLLGFVSVLAEGGMRFFESGQKAGRDDDATP